MEQAKFIEELESLEAFFEKELTIEQLRDWYEELKDISVEKLRVTIREAKKNCKFMPKLAEFLTLMSEVKTERHEEKEKVECKKCGGSGYIPYINKILNGNKILEYTSVCKCSCGNADILDIKTEQQLIAEGYKPIYALNANILLRYEQDLWR